MRLGACFRPTSESSALPHGNAVYREEVLSAFRLFTALALLASFSLIRPLARCHDRVLLLILLGYALSSVVLFLMLSRRRSSRMPPLVFMQTLDTVWPCLLCLVTGCLASPFLLLMIFALFAAPYRRTARIGIAIPLFGIAIVLGVSALSFFVRFTSMGLLAVPQQPASFAVKTSILAGLGLFLTYAGGRTEREHQGYAAQCILRRLRSNTSIQTNLREVLPLLVEIFGARTVVLALKSSSGLHIFECGTSDRPGSTLYCRLPETRGACFFWRMPMTCWSLACSRSGRGKDYLALDRQGGRIAAAPEALDADITWDHPFRTLLTTTLQFGGEWSGRIFVIDPSRAGGRESSLRLLHCLADEVGPTLYSFHLWQNTTARVRAVERRRLARDLHDGVVQSLIATEIQLDVLRRRKHVSPTAENPSEALLTAQNILRAEVRKIREEMDRLRANEVSHRVQPRLSDLLERFQQESGILTRFICEIDEEAIPLRIGEDLVRVVEEALSNVRRHSGARTVEVRLSVRDQAWEVVIQDDGRGFDFSGSLSLAQLEEIKKGPQSIRERVQSVNGDLILESHPDRGASVKVRLASNL